MTYSWHRVDGNLPTGSTGQHSDTLTIRRVTPYDEGMYYCTARKSGISVDSSNGSIEVDGKKIYKSLFKIMHPMIMTGFATLLSISIICSIIPQI